MEYFYNLLLRYGLPGGILIFMLGTLFFGFVKRAVGVFIMLLGIGIIVAYYVYWP